MSFLFCSYINILDAYLINKKQKKCFEKMSHVRGDNVFKNINSYVNVLGHHVYNFYKFKYYRDIKSEV